MSTVTSTVTVDVDSANTTLIKYNPGPNADWYFTHSGNQEVYDQTLTTTVNPGGSATFQFVGTGVQVFGTLGPATNGSSPPVSIYSIDGATPISYVAPNVTSEADGVKFFDSGTLPNGTHTLAFNITQVSPYSQYMLDYIAYTMLVPASSSSSSSSTPSSSSSSTPSSSSSSFASSAYGTANSTAAMTTKSSASATSTDQPTSSGGAAGNTSHSSSTPVGAIVGGVVGGIAGLAVVLLALFFWWRRRRAGRGAQFYYSTPVYPYNPDDGSEDAALQSQGVHNIPPHLGLGAGMVQSGPSATNDSSSLVAWQTPGSGPSGPSTLAHSTSLSLSSPGVLITPFTAAAPSAPSASTPRKALLHPTTPVVAAADSSSTHLEAHQLPLPPGSSSGSSELKSASAAETSSLHPLVEALPAEPNMDSGIRFPPRIAPSEVGILDAPPVYTEA